MFRNLLGKNLSSTKNQLLIQLSFLIKQTPSNLIPDLLNLLKRTFVTKTIIVKLLYILHLHNKLHYFTTRLRSRTYIDPQIHAFFYLWIRLRTVNSYIHHASLSIQPLYFIVENKLLLFEVKMQKLVFVLLYVEYISLQNYHAHQIL